ncbi:MAG: zinc ribbon domain-containing protein [Clostridia bacterium]|nr:zinc ribbon domain-containing protein [Clostridia bacterium]
MQCNACHKQIPDGADFCPSCGHYFTDKTKQPKIRKTKTPMEKSRLFFHCVYVLLFAVAFGFCFYRFLCIKALPATVLQPMTTTEIFLSLDTDGKMTCTVIPSESSDRLTVRIAAETESGPVLSEPIAYDLQLKPETPSVFSFGHGKVVFHPAGDTTSVFPISGFTADTEARLVFTRIGEPRFESPSFRLLTFLTEDGSWN